MNDIKRAIETLNYVKTSVGVFGQEDDIDLAISALEKQMPEKPIEATWDYEKGYECPICGYVVKQNQKYCSTCGQKLETDIDWSWEAIHFD
jgi:rubrerythrin